MCFCEKHRFIRTKCNSPPINGQCTNFLFHIRNTVSGNIIYDSNVNNNSRLQHVNNYKSLTTSRVSNIDICSTVACQLYPHPFSNSLLLLVYPVTAVISLRLCLSHVDCCLHRFTVLAGRSPTTPHVVNTHMAFIKLVHRPRPCISGRPRQQLTRPMLFLRSLALSRYYYARSKRFRPVLTNSHPAKN